MTARMCHWVIGMMFNKSAGCVSSLKASALQTCVFHRPLAFSQPSLHIYSIQVLRLECLTQDSPRGQVKGPRYLLAPWIPHSRSCLWWKPERRDPPERWLHPSCPKEQMGSWWLFRVLLELQVETQPQPYMQYTTLFRATYVFVLFRSIPTKTHRHPADQNSCELR